MTEQERAQRNMRPHAEARLAMWLWSREYAHEQNGGSMDFWDAIGELRRRHCIDLVDEILRSYKENGRATALINADQ